VAGDWIKVEKCSAGKPEVMRLARLWGIPQDQAFGMLVRFWVWIDDACVDGRVDGVASHEIDDMMRFPGFAQGLVTVKWLDIDDSNPCTRIPNFDKHNAETAKKRALRNERQSRWRHKNVDAHVDAHVDSKTSTREEKRREDIDTSLRSVSTRKKLDAPTEDHERIAVEQGVSCKAEFEKYRDWVASKGRPHKDEVAGFRNWLRNAKRPLPGREPTLAEKRARNMDLITGKVRDERTVEGTAERVGGAVVLTIPTDLREPGGDDVGGRGPGRIASGMGREPW
jgi:hypothetical protein